MSNVCLSLNLWVTKIHNRCIYDPVPSGPVTVAPGEHTLQGVCRSITGGAFSRNKTTIPNKKKARGSAFQAG